MISTDPTVLRVAMRPLDEARRSRLDELFGARIIDRTDNPTMFLDVDAIVKAVADTNATIVVVEPLNSATAQELVTALSGTAQLWKQTFVEERSASRPWERVTHFDDYELVA